MKDSSCEIAAKTTAVKPAAGPLTLTFERLKNPTTTPPITPEIIPESIGAPLANETPKQRGKATRKTTILAGKSYLNFETIIC